MQTTMKASYAYGPVTVAVTQNEYDDLDAAKDEETESWKVSYTVSDDLSVSYGSETLETGEGSTVDEEVEALTVSYTTGGMTLQLLAAEGEQHFLHNCSYS